MLKKEREFTTIPAEEFNLNIQFFRRTGTDLGQLAAELETISSLLNVFDEWLERRGRISDHDRTPNTYELNRLWDEAPTYHEVLFSAMKNVRELHKEMNDLYKKLDGR